MIFILASEVYLVFTSVSYVVFKLRYHLPPLLKFDFQARRYRCLAEFSRSGFLVVVTAYTALKVCWTGIFEQNTSRWPCNLFFRIPTLYFYVCMNCRVVFAYARLGLFKSCCNKPFVNEKIGFVATLLIMFVATTWNQALLKYDIVNGVCLNLIHTGVIVTCTFAFVTFEVVSFILFYRPLRETDNISVSSVERCSTFLTTGTRQAGDSLSESKLPSASSESVFLGMSISSSPHPSFENTAITHKISMNSIEMIKSFHRSVKRNFYAGLATIIIALLQAAFGIFFDGSESAAEFGLSSATRTWFWGSGFGQVVDKGLSVALYMSMMLSESNWKRAFVPFTFWQEESWDL